MLKTQPLLPAGNPGRKFVIAGTLLAAAFAALFCFPTNSALAQIKADPSQKKQSDALRSVFKSVSAQANHSTVSIKSDVKGTRRQIAFGTIVSADGFILTKASIILGQSKVWVTLTVGSSFKDYDAKIVGFSEAQDLAMLKVDAVGLTPVIFADTRPLVSDTPETPPARGPGGPGGGGGGGGRGRGGRGRALVLPGAASQPAAAPGAIEVDVGEWVATANSGASNGPAETTDEPYAVGVISVARRRIPGRDAFLGVSMAETDPAATRAGPNSNLGTGVKIMQVVAESAAEKAGVKVGDIIIAVKGIPTPNVNAFKNAVSRFSPGESVTLTVHRDDATLTLTATFDVRAPDSPEQAAMDAMLEGELSFRASDFTAVYQHDTVIPPTVCGGPVVDLEGRVIGINIARAGRTETYCPPRGYHRANARRPQKRQTGPRQRQHAAPRRQSDHRSQLIAYIKRSLFSLPLQSPHGFSPSYLRLHRNLREVQRLRSLRPVSPRLPNLRLKRRTNPIPPAACTRT